MNPRIPLALGFAFLAGLCSMALVSTTTAQAPATHERAQVQRYQAFVQGDSKYMIDTSSGQTWRCGPQSDHWEHVLDPPKR